MTDSFFSDAETGAPKPYLVLARKYRPQTFADLIGQDAMVATLRNAFAQGRIAQGYMLTGVRGVGKTTTARILARGLNFEPADTAAGPGKPTVDLPSERSAYGRHCAEIMESRHADVIEMDAASNTGVDNVREIIESARYKPLVARYKVFIIDEVHMLSKGAFNALLKTLEEPPEHVKFIFATTEIRKVPVTVLSRCQRFDLRRVDVPLLTAHFERIVTAEGARAEPEALRLIARAAEGSVRDGLSILDQAIAFSSGDVRAEGVRGMLGLADRGRIFDLLDTLFAGRPGDAVGALEALHQDGAEPVQVLGDLAEAVHLSTRVKAIGPDAVAPTVSAEELRRASTVGGAVSIALLSRYWQMLLKGIEEAGRAGNAMAAAEMVLIRIAYTADLPGPEDVVKLIGAGASPRAPSAPAARSSIEAPAAARSSAAGAAEPRAQGRDVRPGHRSSPVAPSTPPPPVHDDEHPEAAGIVQAGGLDSVGIDRVSAARRDPESDPTSDPGIDPEDPLYADTTLVAPGSTASLLAPDPSTFAEVVDLASARRDGKLKYHLEENVSLVRYDRTARVIEIALLPSAPPEIANALRERLNQWTGHTWFVAVARTAGAPTLGEQRRAEAAAELARLKTHPSVAALFEAFPDAEVTAVRPLDPIDAPGAAHAERSTDETGTG
ncbi:MAG: DNA polymerase III subunit gamma/tau [Hyphomicrobiaceae bacterium]|nr:DNA polymerase III subunit gamma/tau [Hyphomicrobiaceae bacterium]